MPELAARVRYRVRFRAAARAVAHALCRLGAVLFAGGVVVGNILLPCKAVVQGGDILGFCMGGAGAGESPDPLSRAGGGRRHRAAVPYKVSGWVCDRFAGSSRHDTAGRVIFDFPAGVQRANIRLDLCAVHRTVLVTYAAIADTGSLPVIACLAAPHLQLRIAGNRDVSAAACIKAAANACAAPASGGTDLAAGDRDVISIPMHSAADTRSERAAGGSDLAARDGDVIAIAPTSAADTGTVVAAICGDFAAGDSDVAAVTVSTATDASTIIPAPRRDLAAGDGDVAASAAASSADACAVLTALGVQGAVFILVLNGQITVVALFQAGMRVTALKRVASVQLDVHIALAGGGNGGLARTAHVDVCAGEGDVCGLVFLRIDGDGVFRRASRNDGGIVRNIDLRPLGDRLPAASGVDGDVAVADVPLRCQRRHGQAGEKQQRKER